MVPTVLLGRLSFMIQDPSGTFSSLGNLPHRCREVWLFLYLLSGVNFSPWGEKGPHTPTTPRPVQVHSWPSQAGPLWERSGTG